jgi:16S rRNA (adenine1518-N6/adenine1519-N6)-dimethyltransferase
MSAIDDLPPLRDVIARHGLSAIKGLGQNFLLDLNLTARIARAAGPMEGRTIIEVGPGPGGLTRALLASGAPRVIAIERDARCLPALMEISERYPGRLEVLHADALDIDFNRLADGPTRIVANLPYNIATPLLVGWLRAEPWPPFYESLTLMFQREVAERIVAPPRGEAYGRLGVLAGWRSEARILFNVPPSAFTPPPKVVSSVVGLTPRPAPLATDPARLERVVAAAFGQRRKMLRQSLRPLGVDPLPLLSAAAIEPTQRAEEIGVAGFVALANAFAAATGAD